MSHTLLVGSAGSAWTGSARGLDLLGLDLLGLDLSRLGLLDLGLMGLGRLGRGLVLRGRLGRRVVGGRFRRHGLGRRLVTVAASPASADASPVSATFGCTGTVGAAGRRATVMAGPGRRSTT